MLQSKYLDFELDDFLEDDYFIEYIIGENQHTRNFWNKFLEMHPEKNATALQAGNIIRAYRAQQTFLNTEQESKVWERIQVSVEAQQKQRITIFASFPLAIKATAAAIILLVITFGWYKLYKHREQPEHITETTGFGEVRIIELPDRSTVTLNANSTLSFHKSMGTRKVREVWIEGEGYFKVLHLNKDTTHIKQEERFLVHCNDIDIEVLGTTFNVKSRRGKTNVTLLSGKVRIDNGNTAPNKQVIMLPGETVQYKGSSLQAVTRLPKPLLVTTWVQHELSFTNATLNDIFETLQDDYGYKVQVLDSTLLGMKTEGEISVKNVPELLDVIQTILAVNIEQLPNKQLTISLKQ